MPEVQCKSTGAVASLTTDIRHKVSAEAEGGGTLKAWAAAECNAEKRCRG